MGRMQTVEPLARSDAGAVAAARRHLEALIATSSQIVQATGHDPDIAPCADAGCRLAAVADGPELCRVAHRLAALEQAPAAPLPLDEAMDAFRVALTEALDAVRTCRQTAHPVGVCWFEPTPHVDGCADVLHLAHRLG